MTKKAKSLKRVKRKPRMNLLNKAASTNHIRNWRLFRNILTHEDLSEETFKLKGYEGMTRPTISRLESGKMPYHQAQLEALAKILDCDPWQLIGEHPRDAEKREEREKRERNSIRVAAE